MKILNLSTSDAKAGGFIGAYRLHIGLLNNNIDSNLIVNKKYSDDFTVKGPQTNTKKWINFLKPWIANLLIKFLRTPNKSAHFINLFPSNLPNFINESDADLVILHCVYWEMISISEIGKIQKPIVWTLHDQWPFYGTEHFPYSDNDKRYIYGYTSKNRPRYEKGLDFQKWTWKRKLKHWYDKPMSIVSCSNWLAERARSSYLFKQKQVEVIPNGVDTNIYKPIDKITARKILNLPQYKKIVLFGAMSATSDKKKGFHLLHPALQKFTENSNTKTAAVIFGASRPSDPPDFNMPTYYLSTLQDDWSLVLAYSAADLFVLPTMHDNLPYTIIESMACKTPCVSFSVGGLPDMIDHNVNGYLATPFDPEDLANGIQKILENDELRYEMAENCRRKTLKEFDVDVQVKRYLELFKSL